MTIFTSTGRRREMGHVLRGIREGQGYNGTEMANRLNWTATMLSRAETGKRQVSDVEIALYLGVCGVTGPPLKDLMALAEEPDDLRVKLHLDEIPDQLRALVFHESTANAIDIFEPIYIPGITQTPGYARALLEEGGTLDPADIDNRVEIRMARRVVITRYDPAQCQFFVHENALRSMVGNPAVMVEQMLHLLFVSDRPQCSIRVVPASAGARGLTHGSFHIFRYPGDPAVVYVQNEITSEFLESKEALSSYQARLNRIASVALSDAESREFILSMAGEYERQGAPQDEERAGGSEGLAQE